MAYLSRCVVALSDFDLTEMGERAAARNKLHGVTGLLLFDGRRFIQALEGDEAQVAAIMSRIVLDPRHDSVEIMARGWADQRRFGSWAMSCKRVGSGCCTPEFLMGIKERMQNVGDPSLQAAFIGFAKLASETPNPDYVCPAATFPAPRPVS